METDGKNLFNIQNDETWTEVHQSEQKLTESLREQLDRVIYIYIQNEDIYINIYREIIFNWFFTSLYFIRHVKTKRTWKLIWNRGQKLFKQNLISYKQDPGTFFFLFHYFYAGAKVREKEKICKHSSFIKYIL